ncbi:hypothetical protein A9Q87_07840 [Flavobacteriales bacterium 34_180_T64]|nr:hypothetical protein A9Q87_07840 [Flavobacteriales bacterium 34_180_T64]
MKAILICFALSLSFSTLAKEWKSIKVYQEETKNVKLLSSDWLKSDRLRNTEIWQKANRYNLTHNKPFEYLSIKQRRDFYRWLNANLKQKGHEVVWVSMASYISHKLRLVVTFPQSMFTNKALKKQANMGSETVFNASFTILKDLFLSEQILRNEAALHWDMSILFEEQYNWLATIFSQMDSRTIYKIERMAKGQFLYGLIVPKSIRFTREISNSDDRYNYAINILREYCKSLNE